MRSTEGTNNTTGGQVPSLCVAMPEWVQTMPNVKLCREGKALYHNPAVKKYGADVVDAITPVMEFRAHIRGHDEREAMIRVYLITDLEEIAAAKRRVQAGNTTE